MKPLPMAAPVLFSVIEGKDTGQTCLVGQLLEIGESMGLLQSQQLLNKLDNVKICLLDNHGERRSPSLLGKITEIRPGSPPAFVVNFSFIPPKVWGWLGMIGRNVI